MFLFASRLEKADFTTHKENGASKTYPYFRW